MRVRIVWPRRGLGVILRREDRKCFVPKTFHGSIVQIEVGDLEIGGARYTIQVTLHRKAVILRCNENFSRGQVANRMVSTPVTIGQLHRMPAESQSQQLVTETNAERRDSATGQRTNILDCRA